MCNRSSSILNITFWNEFCLWSHTSSVKTSSQKGDKSQVSNYRPIALLCIVSKAMETYIYNNVFKVVEPIINTNQHGFMNGKSCTTQLLTVYDEIGKYLDEGKQTDMIFLDFSKAFDSVDHNMLIHKLHKLGFWGKLLLWISDYLVHYYFYFL